MAFTLEDGTGLPNSNAYVTAAEANTYLADRGSATSAWDALGTSEKQRLIVLASDYVDVRFVWRGERSLSSQNMEWPRRNAQRNDGYLLTGIPTELKEAVIEYANRAAAAPLAPDPLYQDENAPLLSKREKVGPLETEVRFAGGGSVPSFRKYPTADEKLRELIVRGQRLRKA